MEPDSMRNMSDAELEEARKSVQSNLATLNSLKHMIWSEQSRRQREAAPKLFEVEESGR
jgi:ribosomal protein L29